jgi:hypothetical protein
MFRDVGVAGSNPVTPTIDFKVFEGSSAFDFINTEKMGSAPNRCHE